MISSLDFSQNLHISPSYNIPEWLHYKLEQTWQQQYEEFYEETNTIDLSLENTILNILDTLNDGNADRCHLRYVCMAVILALAVEPTIKAYNSLDTRPEKIFKWVEKWLETQQPSSSNIIHELFPDLSEGTQALDEALDVFKNVLQVLEPSLAKSALLEIIENCLESYAIFPGSQGRRDLFNWWLSEVVPASWCLEFPEKIYTIKGIQVLDEHPLERYLVR